MHRIRPYLFYISIFVISWGFALLDTAAARDLWARLAVGKIFLETGMVLKNDIFSFTATNEWIDHEWGSGVVFYFLADHFGDLGLIAFKVLSIFIVLLLICRIIKLQKADSNSFNLLYYLLIMLAMYNGFAMTVRCQLFTFVFFALWIFILEKVRNENSRLLWILPFTMIIWANLHGGFVAGLGLLGIYALGEFLNKKPFKNYIVALVLSSVATLINPYGLKYLKYIFYAVTMDRSTIAEWWPTNLFGPFQEWIFLKLFIIMAIIAVVRSLITSGFKWQNCDKTKYLLLIVTMFLAIKHVRHQPFFVIAAGSLLYNDFYSSFCPIRSKLSEKAKILLDKFVGFKEITLYSVIIFFGCLFIVFNPPEINIYTSMYPVGSLEFIKQNRLSGNLLTDFNWGSYAAWKLYPQNKIAIDGRYEEVYTKETSDLVTDFTYVLTKDWDKILKKYKVDVILINRTLNSYNLMKQNKNWVEVCQDEISSVFIPANSPKKNFIVPKLDQTTINKTKYTTQIIPEKLLKMML